MISFEKLYSNLKNGYYDDKLRILYVQEDQEATGYGARERALYVAENFRKTFSPDQDTMAAIFSAPGRTEIGGNHTDHQHGCVLCASVNLDILACAAPNGTGVIRICSEGYPALCVDISRLQPVPAEKNTSAALVRGMVAAATEKGFAPAGFDAWMTSDVLSGSGLSSSAAYEVLIGNIINHLFCGDRLDAVTIAKMGQYVENVYFGKPCGLMDQMASSVGNIVTIDFMDPAVPVVRKIQCDFSGFGHALCIIDTGSSHDDLTDDYADITREMRSVAAYFGQQVLRDVPEPAFCKAIPALRETCGDRATLRALHFFADNRRAVAEAEALDRGDFVEFLRLVNESGISSATDLQNTWSVSNPKQQAIPVALAVGRQLLEGSGAIRVHGGGFAGTIQAFVPEERLAAFKKGMEELVGKDKCYVLCIRPMGGCVVTE